MTLTTTAQDRGAAECCPAEAVHEPGRTILENQAPNLAPKAGPLLLTDTPATSWPGGMRGRAPAPTRVLASEPPSPRHGTAPRLAGSLKSLKSHNCTQYVVFYTHLTCNVSLAPEPGPPKQQERVTVPRPHDPATWQTGSVRGQGNGAACTRGSRGRPGGFLPRRGQVPRAVSFQLPGHSSLPSPGLADKYTCLLLDISGTPSSRRRGDD